MSSNFKNDNFNAAQQILNLGLDSLRWRVTMLRRHHDIRLVVKDDTTLAFVVDGVELPARSTECWIEVRTERKLEVAA